jgi:hypothetical protein
MSVVIQNGVYNLYTCMDRHETLHSRWFKKIIRPFVLQENHIEPFPNVK